MPRNIAKSTARLRTGPSGSVRHLAMVFGDHLDPARPTLVGSDPLRDAARMVEVKDEATHVQSHRQRMAGIT